MGRSGLATLELLKESGAPTHQICTFDIGSPGSGSYAHFHSPEEMLTQFKPKTLVVSPGVPLAQAWIQEAHKKGVVISSELSLAAHFLQGEKIISVTGSIAKSTVTSLIGEAAKAQDPNCFVGGNLGTPLAEYIVQKKRGRPMAEWVILELSSYQLENFFNLQSEVSVFTFLTPNHLERYSSLRDYYDQKWSLLQKTKRAIVLNSRGGDLSQDFDRQLRENKVPSSLSVRWTDRTLWPAHLEPKLLGEYNKDNLALAKAVIDFLRWPEASLSAVTQFPGLSHRLENLGEWSGRICVNDSKATTMESVLSAAETLVDGKIPVVLLLGGHDKNLPWETLSPLVSKKNLRFVFFGEYGPQAQTKTKLSGPVFKTLKDTMNQATSWSRPGDLILLSPGGTSHDEFKNFEERGQFFKNELARVFKK